MFFFSSFAKFLSLASENRILLKVNNELITTIDVLNEISYLKSINKSINNLENQKIIEIARNSLIKDKIKKITLIPIVKNFEISDDDFNRILVSNYSNKGFKLGNSSYAKVGVLNSASFIYLSASTHACAKLWLS